MRPDEYAMWLERAGTGKNVNQLEEFYDELIVEIKKIDPLTISETAEVQYIGEGVPRLIIPFLHSWFVLEFLPYRITGRHGDVDTLPLKVLVLQHLIAAAENQAASMRVVGEWIDCRSLANAKVMGAHFMEVTAELLARFFALEREDKLRRVLKWSGKPIDLGDEAYVFKIFPRLPVAFINWAADDEFPAYSKILFDVSAANYMPTHGLAVLTEYLINRLLEG
jgi:hypothetical protein